jgi:hypothetical protein
MKPRFVHNWPQVKEDNDILAKRIKNKIEEYRNRKVTASPLKVERLDLDKKSEEGLFKDLKVK